MSAAAAKNKPGLAVAILSASKKPKGESSDDPMEPMADDATDDEMDMAAFDEFAHAMKSGDHDSGLAALKSIINSCMAYSHGED